MRRTVTAMVLAAVVGAAPGAASAFCGFYVSGAGADLFNNATQVVLMREGTRTVLSMQNNYQGPPEDFAMVVPVPMVLQEENVKTLDKGIFARVDQLAAPRLVEYWEQDPCAPQHEYKNRFMRARGGMVPSAPVMEASKDLGVTIEAQFTVGEYQIVILGARDSAGLDTWLRQEKYRIPPGAEPLLRPYVQSGMKFFVAKVDTKKVRFQDGMAMLSPLRFHYDSDEFNLPVRLGMMNSAGTQDLIVHILAQGQRYEVANYPNTTIPTNLDVKDAARERFGEFYAALFDRTVEANPGAVVTEYAWDAATCDPCPTPALSPQELSTLGHDVLYTPMPVAKSGKPKNAPKDAVDELLAKPQAPPGRIGMARRRPPGGFVLTRLHMRYGKGALADDLVFRAAQPIAGGREVMGAGGTLEQGATPAGFNNFQARYAIRHAWTGAVACENPRRGIWGGPPGGLKPALEAATGLAFAPRGKVQLASFVTGEVPGLPASALTTVSPTPAAPALSQTGAQAGTQADPQAAPQDDIQAGNAPPQTARTDPAKKKTSKGCQSNGQSGAAAWLLVLGLFLLGGRRSRTRHPALHPHG